MYRFFRKIPCILHASWQEAILIRKSGTCSKKVVVLAGEVCLIKAFCACADPMSCLNIVKNKWKLRISCYHLLSKILRKRAHLLLNNLLFRVQQSVPWK